MSTKLDARQTVSRDVLDQLASAAGVELDNLLRSLNSNDTPPLKMSVTGTDRVVSVGSIFVTNPETSKNRTIPTISNTLPSFTSGTITAAATGAGNLVYSPSTASPTAIGMVGSQFRKFSINLDAAGNLTIIGGTAGASLAAATAPPSMNNTFGIYNNDQAIDMMLAAIAAGHSSIGGSSKIITEALGIEAQAICFPMLVHEIIKGYWSIIAQSGLTGSEEEKIATINKVDKLENEPLDIRYGPIIFKKLETIYNAFTPSDIDPRTFVMFYMSVLKLEPEDKFFSFVSNIVGDKPLSEDQIAWIENKLESMQAYLRKKDSGDQLRQLGINETTKLTNLYKLIKEESTQYNIEGLLQTNTEERPQKDILSDIRSLPGITIVSAKDYDLSGESSAFSNPNYYTILKIKVDPHPYQSSGGFKDEDLKQLLRDIRAIKGVRNFKLTQSIEKKTV
jgi:hypothetical protein